MLQPCQRSDAPDRIVPDVCGNGESICVKYSSFKTTGNRLIPSNDLCAPVVTIKNDVQPAAPRSISNPKDIRVLEEVIIKPFVDVTANDDGVDGRPRIKEFQKFKYPPHITWHTSVDRKTVFECKICQKSFQSKSNRKYHLYCDSSVEKPFKCAKCPKSFASKNHLEYHENRHKNIQHKCNDCDRIFLSRISLRKHSKVHTNDFKYTCDHCDRRFLNKSELILHMYSHKKSPLPFKCDDCDKSFPARFKLNQHREMHKATRPHTCQFCGKTFTRNSSLTIHMLTHSTLDTKYECHLCSKSFDRQRSHDRHMKIKHGSTEFRCPLCDVQSGRKDNILRHIRNLHSDENFDEIIQKISKTAARINVPDAHEPSSPSAAAIPSAPESAAPTVIKAPSVCQYQSVIQFAARSKTPVPILIEVIDCSAEPLHPPPTNTTVTTPRDDDTPEKNPPAESFNKELRIELTEPTDSGQKISNITIYRQLLSPYLRPPPNLDCINGTSQAAEAKTVHQRDRLPIRKENVDIYRSILLSTSDHEHQSVIARNDTTAVPENAVKPVGNKASSLVIHGQSNEYFSEMHWRKRTSQCFNQMEQ